LSRIVFIRCSYGRCVVFFQIFMLSRKVLAVAQLTGGRLSECYVRISLFAISLPHTDRLCGLVVRVSGYRYRGLGFDSRRYQIF
jgi:hypothetical protein